MICKTEIKMLKKYIVILIIAAIIFGICYYLIEKNNNTINIKYEENVIVGIPENIPEEMGYDSIFVEEGYEIALCGYPSKVEERLEAYITNNQENNVWIVVKIYDSNDNKVGETGIIKQGEYVKDIKLNKELSAGNITIKIIAYEPNTFESRGNIAFKTIIK